MPRKPNAIPSTQWSIMIPVDLAFRVEHQLTDAVTGKAHYGSRSMLIQALLLEWLEKQPQPGATAAPYDAGGNSTPDLPGE